MWLVYIVFLSEKKKKILCNVWFFYAVLYPFPHYSNWFRGWTCVGLSRFCLEDILWNAPEPFADKLGSWVHHHEPECHAERFTTFRLRSWWQLRSLEKLLFLILGTAEPFAAKLCMTVDHHEPEHHVKKFWSRSQWGLRSYLQSCCTWCNQSWYDGA